MKTETVFASLALIGLFLKSLHIPGGNILVILALLILALLYFPFGFYFLSHKSIKTNLGISILYGWLLNVIFIGVMFRIMHWPGAMVMAIIGTLTAIPLGLFAYFKFKNSDEENVVYFRNLLIRTSILLLISTFFIFYTLPF